MNVESQVQEMVEVLRGLTIARRQNCLMDTAARLFPYLTQDLTPTELPFAVGGTITANDTRRVAAAVDAAFLVEQLIASQFKSTA